MSPILNIILKDFRRLRIPLGGWLLVMSSKYTLGFYLVLAADLPESSWAWGELRTACMVFGGLETALTFLIAVWAIRGDSVLGTRSSWMTRPISGARLLRAKLGGLAALLVAPAVLLPVPWWLVCGFGAGDVAAAMAEMAAWQVVTIGIALVAAVLADSLGRVIVWTLVTLAILTGPILIGWGAWMHNPGTPGPLPALGILVATGATVVVLQFLTRDRRFAEAIMVLGLPSALFAFMLSFKRAANSEATRTSIEASYEVTRTEWNEALARDIVFDFRGAVRRPNSRPSDDTRPEFLRMTFAARGVPDGYAVGGVAMRHEWFGRSGLDHAAIGRGSGGHGHPLSTSMRTLLGLPTSVVDLETERWRWEQALARSQEPGATQAARDLANLLRDRRLQQPAIIESDEQSVNAVVPVPSSLAAQLQERPARYAVVASIDLVRPERWLELSLAPGSWKSGNARGMRLLHSKPFTVDRSGHRRDQYHVALIETEPTGVLAMALAPLIRIRNPLPESHYVVLNRPNATLDVPSVRPSRAAVTLGGVAVRSRTFEVPIPRVIRNGEWTNVAPDWQADAKLGLLGWRRAATFHREIQVENFELQPYPPYPSAPRE